MSSSSADDGMRRFRHEAMATHFELRIGSDDEGLARAAAAAAFAEIDRLETRLSRYREGSDIFRINHLSGGESLCVGEDCLRCLELAFEAQQLTGGLFDISIGRAVQRQRREQGIEAAETGPEAEEREQFARGRFALHPGEYSVSCASPGRELDLGGIGKGFALDRAREVLREWEIRRGLLSSGGSTILVFQDEPGLPAWPVNLAGDTNGFTVELRNEAISGSGTAVKGSHIILPGGGEAAGAFRRAWVRCADAALSDAFSTAIMLMRPEQLEPFVRSARIEVWTESPQNGEILRTHGK